MKIRILMTSITVIVLTITLTYLVSQENIEVSTTTKTIYNEEKARDALSLEASTDEETSEESNDSTTEEVVIADPIVYDGLTLEELSAKLDRSLTSTLAGTGHIFATKAIELGIDPYLSVAIVLHETGCAWTCSTLVSACNNVGGMKGSGCGDSSYAAFSSLEEGINAYMNNLANNYINKGLNTAELMERSYTGGSTTWAIKVNNYIEQIKSR